MKKSTVEIMTIGTPCNDLPMKSASKNRNALFHCAERGEREEGRERERGKGMGLGGVCRGQILKIVPSLVNL